MIVEIEKARPSVSGVLDYNEDKVLGGVAELVGYANLRSTSREDIYALFSRYERAACGPTMERSFHASVNPSETDSCTEDQVLDFIAGMMDYLGYGEQPYLVYRHFDIEREHYHVVSIRIRRNGRKINNYYEKRRASNYMRMVARQYSFSIPEKGERASIADDLTDAGKKPSFRFTPGGNVTRQLKEIIYSSLQYDFESIQQLSLILKDRGVKAEFFPSKVPSRIILQGLDKKGEPATEKITGESLDENLQERISEAVEKNRNNHRHRYREKERVRSLVGFAFDISRSESHFVNILRKKGIWTHFSRTKESGDIFGVTFVDHSSRTVFKASELREVISVRKMQDAVSTGKWRVEDKGAPKNSYVRSSRAAIKQDSIRLRDLHVGTAARVLQPVGQPHGSSWSGKVAPTKEELRAKWEAGKTGSMFADFVDRRYEEKLK